MGAFLVYFTATGQIDRYGNCQDGMELNQANDSHEIAMLNEAGARPDTHYIELGPPVSVEIKPAMPTSIDHTYITAGSTQTATISGVPAGATLYINDHYTGNIDDGTAEFTGEDEGRYVLRLEHYRYLITTYTVDVGVISFDAGGERETGHDMPAPFGRGGEIETGVDAQCTATIAFAAGGEAEAGGAVIGTITVVFDVGGEVEMGHAMAALLGAGGEIEGGGDAEIEWNMDEGGETESGYDVAA